MVFDLDGTLMDHPAASRAALAFVLCLEADVDAVSVDRLYRRWRSLERVHFQRHLDGRTTFAGQRVARVMEFGAAAGLPLAATSDAEAWFAGYLAECEARWTAFPDVGAALGELRRQGFLLSVLTNGDHDQQARKLRRLGLGDLPMLASSDVGARKPDGGIFRAACRAIGRDEAACAYVGDDPANDALAAARAGLRGIWIDRRGRRTAPEGIETIRELTELAALVAAPSRLAVGP